MMQPERVYSVLLVSAAQNLNAAICELLPASVFTPVLTVSDVSAARRALARRAYDIVIVNSPVWLLGLMNKGVEIKEVCCGNNSSSGADSVQVSGTLYASKEDLAAYKEMINRGVRFYWQTTPEVVPEELNEKLLKL